MSDIEPTWEMSDAELAEYLSIDIALVVKIPPATRSIYERLAWMERELSQGRVPPAVIVCED